MRNAIEDFIYREDGSKVYFEAVVQRMKEAGSVALFGAGQGGKQTYAFMARHDLQKEVVCFIDNNPRKWGTELFGVPVVALKDFQEQELSNCLIVVSCGEGDEIMEQCVAGGIPSERIMIPDLTLLNVAGVDYRLIWDHIPEFNAMYAVLSDEASKKTAVNLLNYKISHDSKLLKEIYCGSENQYFEPGLIHFKGDETFVDCGAYVGDTVDSLLSKYELSTGRVRCFEADESNYAILDNHIAELTKSLGGGICYKLAVWSRKDILRFDAVGSGSGFVDEKGSSAVSADSLDNVLMDEKVDFIKMDIEGAEVNALVGAFHLIQRDHPTLAISVYHKPEHLFQIPLLIKAIEPGYKLYLRHYREFSVTETICYALYNERGCGCMT